MNSTPSRIIPRWQRYAYEAEISTHVYPAQEKPGQVVDLQPDMTVSVSLPQTAKEIIGPYLSDRRRAESDPLYALFPLIIGRDGTHTPIFAVNLSGHIGTIMQGGEVPLDPLASCDLHINTGLLLHYLELEESELPRTKSLAAFIEGILGVSSESFYELIGSLSAALQASAPHLRCRNAIRLDSFNPYRESLPSQLALIAKHEGDFIHSDCAAAGYFEADANAAPPPFDGRALWLGGFDKTHPVMKGQATVLQRMQAGARLLAVQGAPGTGKTTLFLSLIAQEMIARARALAQGKDRPARIAIASTSNKAVQNAAERFLTDPEFATRNDFYFIAGNRAQIQDSITRLETHIDEIRRVAPPAKKTLEKAKKEFLIQCEDLESYFASIVKFYDDLVARLADLGIDYRALPPEARYEQIRATLETQREELVQKIASHEAHYPGIEKRRPANPNQKLQHQADRYRLRRHELCETNGLSADASEAQLQEVHHALASGREALAGLLGALMSVPFWKAEFIFKARRNLTRSFYMEHSEAGFLGRVSIEAFDESTATIIWQKTDQKKRALDALMQMRPVDSFYLDHPDAYEALSRYKTLLEQQKKTEETVQFIEDVAQNRGWQFDRYHDPATILRLEKTEHQRALYDAALSLLALYRDHHAKEVVRALELWKMLLESGTPGKDIKAAKESFKSLKEFDRLVSLSYPVLTSTLASFTNMFPGYRYSFVTREGKETFVDHIKSYTPVSLLLSDESGMCSAHALLPALCLSGRAVVVGDPLQLEPIVTLAPAEIEAHEADYASSADAVAFSPTQVSAYHRAAHCCTGMYSDTGAGVILDQHFRCQKPIAEAFIDIAGYRGLEIRTQTLSQEAKERLKNMGGKHLIWHDILGERGYKPNTNIMEIEAIEKILDQIEEAGYDLQAHVGIITPYRHQVGLLKQRFARRIGHKDRDREAIGTIHKFQGAEYEVIIFSPVVFTRADSTAFINAKPNMLNVALSRAKHLFIVAGNAYRFDQMKGYGKKMLDRTREHGYVVDYQPETGPIESPSAETILKTPCEHIDFFDQAVRGAKKSIKIICPWIRSPNPYASPQLDLLKKAQERGVRVTIEYGWKNETANSDSCPDLLKRYKAVFGENLKRLEKGTHAKVVIVDDEQACIGSFNWLSHPYYETCQKGEPVSKAQLRSEISAVLSGEQAQTIDFTR